MKRIEGLFLFLALMTGIALAQNGGKGADSLATTPRPSTDSASLPLSPSEKNTPATQNNRLEHLIQLAENKLDVANTVLGFVEVFFGFLTLLLIIASILGFREFRQLNTIRQEISHELKEAQKERDKLIKLQDSLIEDSRNRTLALYQLQQAEELIEKGIYYDAKILLKKALKITGVDDKWLLAEIHLLNAGIYVRQEDYDSAITETNKSLEVYPDHYESYRELGGIYLIRKQLDKAEEAFKKAISINSEAPGVFNGLGELYLLKKEFDNAKKSFLRCLDYAPEHEGALLHLGTIYRITKDLKESKSKYEKVEKVCLRRIETGSFDVYTYYILAWIANLKGHTAKSKEYINTAFRYNPSKYLVREIILFFEILQQSQNPSKYGQQFLDALKEKL